MPTPQPVDPMVDELRRRGMLATGGNIRMVPFDVAGGAAVDEGAPNSLVDSRNPLTNVTPNGDGTYTNNETGEVVDPREVAKQVGIDPTNENDMSWLAAIIAGGAGASLGMALGARRGAKLPIAADPLAPLPQIGGTVGVEPDLGPTGTAMSTRVRPEDIIDGEFSVVEPEGVGGPKSAGGIPQQKALTGPTARELAGRRYQPSGVEQSRISLPDEFSDLSPEQLEEAKRVAAELVMRRQRGNVQAFNPSRPREVTTGKPRGRGAGPYPTSPDFKTETPEDVLGHVVRILRDNKAALKVMRPK